MFTRVYGLPDLPLTSLCIGSYWFTQVYPAWFPVFPVRLGGCPALALRALQVAEGTTQLEEAVALIAKEQEAHDVSHGQLAHCWGCHFSGTNAALVYILYSIHLFCWPHAKRTQHFG